MRDGPEMTRKPGRYDLHGFVFSGIAVVGLVSILAAAWYRLFLGFDFDDESGSLVVPWRWTFGDRPFVDEENLAQIPGLLIYPLVRLFGMLNGGDVTGLVLYGRHLYLLMGVAVALVAFVVLRRILRWELALLVSGMCFAYLARDTPQLSSSTMGAAFLTLGAVLGLRAVLEPPARAWALASGVALALAVIAYPTMIFIVPFYGVFLAFALGHRAIAMVAEWELMNPPDPDGPPTARTAWLVVSAWALGGVLVLVPAGILIMAFGLDNVVRCWHHTVAIGRDLGQLGGARKAYEVTADVWRFVWSRAYLPVSAVIVYLAHRRRPVLGGVLLALLPLALWLAGQLPALGSAGLVLLYGGIAPYLFLFVPQAHRPDGARMLIWIWAPSLMAGAMAAYTSSLGYVHASMGLFPSVLVSGVFLAWALEDVTRARARLPWAALAVLLAVLSVAVSFQFGDTARLGASDTVRFEDGPWWGIRVGKSDHAYVNGLAEDLAKLGRADDRLLVFYGGAGTYLLWDGAIGANSYWIRQGEDGESGALPSSTLSYYRREAEVPTLVVHFIPTQGLTRSALRKSSGGLDYPAVLVRPGYSVHRRPVGESTSDVLVRLPR